jgi:hypothetical protein
MKSHRRQTAFVTTSLLCTSLGICAIFAAASWTISNHLVHNMAIDELTATADLLARSAAVEAFDRLERSARTTEPADLTPAFAAWLRGETPQANPDRLPATRVGCDGTARLARAAGCALESVEMRVIAAESAVPQSIPQQGVLECTVRIHGPGRLHRLLVERREFGRLRVDQAPTAVSLLTEFIVFRPAIGRIQDAE